MFELQMQKKSVVWWHELAAPVLRGMRQMDVWDSLSSHSSLIGGSRPMGDLMSQEWMAFLRVMFVCLYVGTVQLCTHELAYSPSHACTQNLI